MKKILFALSIGLIGILNAQDTTETTLNLYNVEIEKFQHIIQLDQPFSKESLFVLYNLRGDLLFSRGDYNLALQDYHNVTSDLENDILIFPSEFLKGLCGSLFCNLCLGNDAVAESEFERLVYVTAVLRTKIETIDWIRNSPVYPRYKNQSYLADLTLKIDLPPLSEQENCEFQCAGYGVAAAYACSKVPVPSIQFLCAGCIFALENFCFRCCKGAGFWENCVKPLRRLFHDPEHPENPAPHPYE